VSAWFVAWIVTTQLVNAAFYLALTRGVRGWVRTVGAYLLGYVAPLLVATHFRVLDLSGGPAGCASQMAGGFFCFYVLWCALTLALSRGDFGRRLFSALICGVHQTAAFSVSLLLMVRLRPEGLAASLAIIQMTAMGWCLIGWARPRVDRIQGDVGWFYLNLGCVALFVALYATGIWPTYVATAPVGAVVSFLAVVLLAQVLSPAVLVFSRKSQEATTLALVRSKMDLLTSEMEIRRTAIEAARRVRHDQRHHQLTLVELLRQGKTLEALDYLEGAVAQSDAQSLAKFVWCENETVNAILSGYVRKAAESHVTLEASAAVPRQLRIPDVELVAVLANLIENAVRAAVPETKVIVQIACPNGVLRFRISNVVPDGFRLKNGLPCARPGVGIRGVKSVVERYGGGFEYVLDGKWLMARGFMSCS